MIKKILATSAIIATSITPAFAGPSLLYGFKTIGYGQFACIQKAESKLFQMSASNVNRNNVINIFGEYPNTTIGIMCRNGEVFVTVAGNDASLLRDELLNFF